MLALLTSNVSGPTAATAEGTSLSDLHMFAEIGLHRLRAPALASYIRADRIRFRTRGIGVDGDRVAGVNQRARDGETDAFGAAGHKGSARRGVTVGHGHASAAELRSPAM